MRKQRSAPEPIGDVLKNVVEELSKAKKKGIFEILSAWPALVGKEFSRHARPASLKKGVLLVSVDESAWLYQANFRKEELLKALKKKVGAEKIRKMQFRIGNIR